MKSKIRNKYIGAFTLIVFTLLGQGCKKDFLDVSPTASIGTGEAFNSEAKLKSAMTGVYDLLTNSGYTNNIIMNGDVKGEDVMVNSTGNYNRFIAGYQYVETVNNSELQTHWQYSYKIIANCNQLIENVPAAPISEDIKNAYTAEARAMRAYAHFQLVREFAKPYALDPNAAGIPLVEKSVGPNDQFPGRAKVSEVYTSILADLNYAAANLPSSRKDVYRLTLNAVQGLLARVYLTMGNWEEASKYAKLARAGYPLSSASALLKGFADPTSEWIWAIDMRSDDNQGFLQVSSFYDPYDQGYSSFRATKEFFAKFADNDIRKNQFRIPEDGPGADPTTGSYEILGDGYLMSKFIFRGDWDNDQLLMRSSEMYLIEAEAEARLGGAAHTLAAQNALFEIQKRAISTAVISTNTGTALVNEVLLERRKELFGEGHRYYDILRTLQPLDRRGSASHWKVFDPPIQPGDKRFALPIPQREINANPNIEQNPL